MTSLEDNELEGVEELFVPKYDYKDAISKTRISATTLEELIDIIEAYADEDINENLVYRMNVTYSLHDNNENFRVKRFMKANMTEMLEYLKEWRLNLIVAIQHSRHMDDVKSIAISYTMIYGFEVEIGSGQQKVSYYKNLKTGELYRCAFEKTIINCLLKSCGMSKRQCQTFKEKNDLPSNWRSNSKVFTEYMKSNYKIDVNVINKIEKYDESKVNILLRGRHAGRLTQGAEACVQEDELESNRVLRREYPAMSDVMRISYDIEWDWNKINDNEYVSSEPKIVTYKITEGDKPPGRTKILNSFSKFVGVMKLSAAVWNGRKKGRETYAFSHNGKQVEHRTLLKHIADFEMFPERPPLVIGNVTGTAVKSFTWSGINFRDTCLFANVSLEHLAKAFALTVNKAKDILPKDENGEADYLSMRWDVNNPDHSEYAMKDTEVLHEFVQVFNQNVTELLSLEKGKFYMADCSMASLCKNIIMSDTKMANTQSMRSWFQTGYCGGRTEMFKWGVYESVAVVDIVSSYPYQMTKTLPQEIVGKTSGVAAQSRPDNVWCARIRCSHEDKFQLLAVRTDESLTFPIINNGWIFIWDFEYYAITDKLVVHEWGDVIYFSTFSLKYFVEPIVALKTKAKKEGNHAAASAAKIAVNSSYGGLALKEQRSVLRIFHKKNKYFTEREENPGNKISYEDTLIGENVIAESSDIRTKADVAVHVASFIAAAARLQLWNKFNELDRLGYMVLYCDTDSVFFTDPNNTYNQSYTELGSWELNKYKRINIVTLKHYELIGEDDKPLIKYKGVKNPKSIDAEQTSIIWKRESLGVISYNSGVKTSTGKYSKGVKLPDGNIGKLNWPL